MVGCHCDGIEEGGQGWGWRKGRDRLWMVCMITLISQPHLKSRRTKNRIRTEESVFMYPKA